MRYRNPRSEKKRDINKMSDRIKMYKRTARRIYRNRRVRAVLVMSTLIVMLAPLTVSSLLGIFLTEALELAGLGDDITRKISAPSVMLLETVVLLIALPPLVCGMRAYAARAAEGDEPSAEIIVGFYSNPTYKSYSRRCAFSFVFKTLFFSSVFVGVSLLVTHLGYRLESHGEIARAAILYFGSLIALGVFFVISIRGYFDGYLYPTLFLRSPGRSRCGIKADADAIIRARPETKREAILLNLSFIGWYAVVFLTAGIAALYVVPYVTVTNAVCRSYMCRGSGAHA